MAERIRGLTDRGKQALIDRYGKNMMAAQRELAEFKRSMRKQLRMKPISECPDDLKDGRQVLLWWERGIGYAVCFFYEGEWWTSRGPVKNPARYRELQETLDNRSGDSDSE